VRGTKSRGVRAHNFDLKPRRFDPFTNKKKRKKINQKVAPDRSKERIEENVGLHANNKMFTRITIKGCPACRETEITVRATHPSRHLDKNRPRQKVSKKTSVLWRCNKLLHVHAVARIATKLQIQTLSLSLPPSSLSSLRNCATDTTSHGN